MPKMDHEFLYNLLYNPFSRNVPFKCFIDNLKQIPLFAKFLALVTKLLTLFNQISNQTCISGQHVCTRNYFEKCLKLISNLAKNSARLQE